MRDRLVGKICPTCNKPLAIRVISPALAAGLSEVTFVCAQCGFEANELLPNEVLDTLPLAVGRDDASAC